MFPRVSPERIASISKALRKYKPVNCSKGRRYLEPYYAPSPPSSPVPKHKPRSVHVSLSKPPPSLQDKQRLSLIPTITQGPRTDTDASPTLELTEGPFRTTPTPRPRTVRICSCYSPCRSKTPSSDVRSRLTDFIAKCDRSESEEKHRRKSPIRLSTSFEDLQQCVQVTKDNTGRGELVPGLGIAHTLRLMRLQRKEEARNVEDPATLRQLVDQKREVSNFIITRFRKVKMWKHAGVIVPRKLEDSLHLYWTKGGRTGIYMVNGALFWEITVQGASFLVRSGRRWQGKETDIQSQETSFPSPEAATQRATDLLGSKVVNGYKILVSPQPSPRPAVLPQRPSVPCVIVEEWRCVREDRPVRVQAGWVQPREVINLEEEADAGRYRGWRGGRGRRRPGRYFF